MNVHGLDADEDPVSSAQDLARLSRELIEYPRILEWSSRSKDSFRDGRFILRNRNQLVGVYPGLDGLKTGFTQRAGFNLVATARRQDMRLISVIMGGRSDRLRDRETSELLSWGFNHFVKGPIAVAGETIGSVPLDWGITPEVSVILADTVIAVLTPEQRQRVKRDIELPVLHEAPVTEGDSIGVLQLSLDDRLLARVDLLAAASVARMSLWEKLMSYF